MYSKIYVTGPVGAGKSTLAKKISVEYGLPYYELDKVVFQSTPGMERKNQKRKIDERDRLFHSILTRDKWIIEDTGRSCFEDGFKQADIIFLIEPPPLVRDARILRRWVRQNLNLEPCGYKPDFSMLKMMFHWSHDFQTGKDGLKTKLYFYRQKMTVIKGVKEIPLILK